MKSHLNPSRLRKPAVVVADARVLLHASEIQDTGPVPDWSHTAHVQAFGLDGSAFFDSSQERVFFSQFLPSGGLLQIGGFSGYMMAVLDDLLGGDLVPAQFAE